MNPTQKLIVKILKSLRPPVYRTKIVKLAYLIDYAYFRNFGRTMTGLQYMWDTHGPNSVGDALVEEARALLRSGVIYMDQVPNQYGDTSYVYGLLDRTVDPKFTPEEEYVISEVIQNYRAVPLNRLISLSKATKPFRKARQYAVLEMERDTPAEHGNADELAEYERSIQESGRRSLAEITAKT